YGIEKDGEYLPDRTDKISAIGPKDMVVPVTIYPDVFKDEMDNRRVKTTITIPRWLKEVAEKEGINYSQLLETAIKDTLEIV
ncbi:MAG: HicB family protein, partial [Treponema sp.]|nr:HicB family protein [Treponema sp.]